MGSISGLGLRSAAVIVLCSLLSFMWPYFFFSFCFLFVLFEPVLHILLSLMSSHFFLIIGGSLQLRRSCVFALARTRTAGRTGECALDGPLPRSLAFSLVPARRSRLLLLFSPCLISSGPVFLSSRFPLVLSTSHSICLGLALSSAWLGGPFLRIRASASQRSSS